MYLTDLLTDADDCARVRFELVDRDGSGSLTYPELVEVFGKCVQSTLPCQVTTLSRMLVRIFKMVDKSRCGALSYDDFRRAAPENGKIRP